MIIKEHISAVESKVREEERKIRKRKEHSRAELNLVMSCHVWCRAVSYDMASQVDLV